MKTSPTFHPDDQITQFLNNPPIDFPKEVLARLKTNFEEKKKTPENICSNIAAELQIIKHYEEAITWYRRAIETGFGMARWWLAEFLRQDTPYKDVEEAIRLYQQSYPTWTDERDRNDTIDALLILEQEDTIYPSAMLALFEIFHQRFLKDHKETDRVKMQNQLDLLLQNAPEFVKEIDTTKVTVATKGLSLEDYAKKIKENEVKTAAKKPREFLPKPRKFTFSDTDIRHSTGKPYVRKRHSP